MDAAMGNRFSAWLALGLLLAIGIAGCERPQSDAQQNELIVVGTIRGQHLTSERYGLETLREMIRAIRPAVVYCEIPPDRLAQALREFRSAGAVQEPRVGQFPEYGQVLFPLADELQFEIVPCAAWTTELEAQRRAALAALAERDPVRHGDARDALDWLAHRLELKQQSDDPLAIHTSAYDEVVAQAMQAYAERVDAHLGDGGWEAINRAHYALIDAGLRVRAGRGERCLLLFGAWHKYWLLERLEQRKDVRIRPLTDFWKPDP